MLSFQSMHIDCIRFFYFLSYINFSKFWLYPDIIYSLTNDGRRWKKACQYVHNVAEDIIEKRRNSLV